MVLNTKEKENAVFTRLVAFCKRLITIKDKEKRNMGDHSFTFTTFEFRSEKPYTITFVGRCTQVHNEVKIDYAGADIKTTSTIPDDWLDDLKENLNKDYGYGPYDKGTIEQIFEEHHVYIF